jgi:hypothetical protein
MSKTFLYKSKACSRRFQNSPYGLRQLGRFTEPPLQFFRFALVGIVPRIPARKVVGWTREARPPIKRKATRIVDALRGSTMRV